MVTIGSGPFREVTLTAPVARWRIAWDRPRIGLPWRLALYLAASTVAQAAVMLCAGTGDRARGVAFIVGLAAQFACQVAVRLRREVYP